MLLPGIAFILLIGLRLLLPSGDDFTRSAAPVIIESPLAYEAAAAPARVNINTASLEELMTLPGIGEKSARNILEVRKSEGLFGSPEALLQVRGIGIKKFRKLKPLITTQPFQPRQSP